MSNLIVTPLPTDQAISAMDEDALIIHTLNRLLEDWKAARYGLEQHWRECWALYFGTKNAEDFLRSRVQVDAVGDVGKDWRHHISQAKAYDLVETAIPYFKSASFPNEDWFDLVPVVPVPGDDLHMALKVLKGFIKKKLDDSNFKSVWEVFLRQLCICGTSVIALPWRLETTHKKKRVRVRGEWGDTMQEMEVEKIVYNAPDMAVEDMFNIYLNPDEDDPNRTDMIRRFTLQRGEIARLVRDGVYPKAKLSDIYNVRPWKRGREERNDVDTFYHVETAALNSDVLELYEFWGCLELPNKELYDVVITWAGEQLLRVETNPYYGGRPFVVGRYTPIPASPFGWGMLSPIMGNLHELNILANSRLDGLEITLQPTFLVRNDGTVDPNDVTVEPGKAIPVADVDGIRQLITDNNFAAVSLQEEQIREQLIERRTGTSSFVGTAPGRSGERVTAKEVEATQSAGGSRLSGVYENIERESLMEVLQRTYQYAQQFQSFDEIIPVQGKDSSELLYAQVGALELSYDMNIKPIGAAHIADKEHRLRMYTDWLAVMNSNEQLMQYINWEEVAREFTRKFIEHEPDRFIQGQEAQAQQMPMGQPSFADAAAEVGGNELKNAVNANMMMDGGMNMMAGATQGLPGLPNSFTQNEQEVAAQYAGAIPAAISTGSNLTAVTNAAPPV